AVDARHVEARDEGREPLGCCHEASIGCRAGPARLASELPSRFNYRTDGTMYDHSNPSPARPRETSGDGAQRPGDRAVLVRGVQAVLRNAAYLEARAVHGDTDGVLQ